MPVSRRNSRSSSTSKSGPRPLPANRADEERPQPQLKRKRASSTEQNAKRRRVAQEKRRKRLQEKWTHGDDRLGLCLEWEPLVQVRQAKRGGDLECVFDEGQEIPESRFKDLALKFPERFKAAEHNGTLALWANGRPYSVETVRFLREKVATHVVPARKPRAAPKPRPMLRLQPQARPQAQPKPRPQPRAAPIPVAVAVPGRDPTRAGQPKQEAAQGRAGECLDGAAVARLKRGDCLSAPPTCGYVWGTDHTQAAKARPQFLCHRCRAG